MKKYDINVYCTENSDLSYLDWSLNVRSSWTDTPRNPDTRWDIELYKFSGNVVEGAD